MSRCQSSEPVLPQGEQMKSIVAARGWLSEPVKTHGRMTRALSAEGSRRGFLTRRTVWPAGWFQFSCLLLLAPHPRRWPQSFGFRDGARRPSGLCHCQKRDKKKRKTNRPAAGWALASTSRPSTRRAGPRRRTPPSTPTSSSPQRVAAAEGGRRLSSDPPGNVDQQDVVEIYRLAGDFVIDGMPGNAITPAQSTDRTAAATDSKRRSPP